MSVWLCEFLPKWYTYVYVHNETTSSMIMHTNPKKPFAYLMISWFLCGPWRHTRFCLLLFCLRSPSLTHSFAHASALLLPLAHLFQYAERCILFPVTLPGFSRIHHECIIWHSTINQLGYHYNCTGEALDSTFRGIIPNHLLVLYFMYTLITSLHNILVLFYC